MVKETAERLQQIYQDKQHVQVVAWWLFEALTGKTKLELLTSKFVVTKDQQEKLDLWLFLLIQEQYPLQYILGSVNFAGLTIAVEPPVLIPRPETEEWVQDFIVKIKNSYQKSGQKIDKILDMCTGSGCIALACAQAFPEAHIYAVDISDYALALAKRNADNNQIFNITFIKSDLFSQVPVDLKFDVIISNPPYISACEWEQLEPVVKKWENKIALMAEDHGLQIIKNLISQAHRYLKCTKNSTENFAVEIGYNQGNIVQKLCVDAEFRNIKITKDSNNLDRVVSGEY